jgi:branched-chain amino acid transport system permease protein
MTDTKVAEASVADAQVSGRRRPRLGFGQPGAWVGLVSGTALIVIVSGVCVANGDLFYERLWLTILMTITYAVTWNLIGGLAGQHSFAHPVFFGVGAYVCATLIKHWPGAPVLVLMLAGGAAATLCAIVMGPCFRARGPFFAILTVAMAEGLRVAGNAFFPGGSSGQYIPISSSPSNGAAVWYALIVVVLAILAHFAFDRSAIGAGLRLIAVDEDAAAAIGVPTTRLKVTAFVAGAPFVGAIGVLFALSNTFIDPDTVFSLNIAILAVLTPLLGGIGLLWGAVTGAIVWEIISDRLGRAVTTPGLTLMVNGAVLVLVINFMPRGIFGTISRWVSRRRRGAT